MNKMIRKMNAAFLGLLMACGVGLSRSNMSKAVAEVYPGCPDSTGGCPVMVGNPNGRVYSGCTTNSGRPLDCCQYTCVSVMCVDSATQQVTGPVPYCTIIGPNAYKDCRNGQCVAFS